MSEHRIPLRIAHVNDIANVSSTLVDGLRLLGHHTELFPLKLVGGRYPTWFKAFLLPWRVWEMQTLNRSIREGYFDAVHIHFAYLGWAGIIGQYPYVLHCHGTDVRRNLHQFYQRPFVVRSLRQARRVFYSTPDLREHVLPVRPDAIWSRNPVDIERFRPADSSGRALGRRPRVLFISSLSRIKGVDRAFQVISLLQKQIPEVEIHVFGFGDRAGRYTRWPGITVLPRVSHADMPALIQDHDVVVGQLRLGILSMSELEAMACGKPVVGENRYPDSYDESPPILTGDTPADLAGQVCRLLGSATVRASVGQRSREWLTKHHNYRQIAREMEGHYRDL